jgi:hypothetical protein
VSDLRTPRRGLPVAFLLGTLTLGVCFGVGHPLPAGAQDWATVQFSRQLQERGETEVRVRYGAGRFSLAPISTDHFYRVRLRYDESAFQPIHDYQPGRLVVGIEGSGRRSSIRRGDRAGELDLELSTRLPMRLHLEFGAVEADVDLGGLRLRTLDLSTGASDSRIRVSATNPDPMEYARFQVGAAAFNASGLGRLNARELEVEAGVGDVKLELSGLERDETRLRAKMGLGSLEIRVPRGVGIRMDRSTFLTSVTAPDLTRRGESYYSSDWDTAERRLILEVEAAFGSVTVARVGR